MLGIGCVSSSNLLASWSRVILIKIVAHHWCVLQVGPWRGHCQGLGLESWFLCFVALISILVLLARPRKSGISEREFMDSQFHGAGRHCNHVVKYMVAGSRAIIVQNSPLLNHQICWDFTITRTAKPMIQLPPTGSLPWACETWASNSERDLGGTQ